MEDQLVAKSVKFKPPPERHKFNTRIEEKFTLGRDGIETESKESTLHKRNQFDGY